MARMLIVPSALEELRELAPLERRRRVVARLSELEEPAHRHRISLGGRCRLMAEGRRVLYREREDGSLVITAVSAVTKSSADTRGSDEEVEA